MDKKAFFNQIAQEWENSHQPNQDKEKLEYLFQGCGTGRLIPFLCQTVGAEGLVVGSDFSDEMLRIAKKNYRQKKLFFLQADAQKLPFRENSFEAVICLALFPHLPDKLKALKEFCRILKPQKIIYA